MHPREGQDLLDRARVLRALRARCGHGPARREAAARRRAPWSWRSRPIKSLEIPHLEWEDEGGQVVH